MKNMKKMFVLLAMFCLCFQTISVYAATPDFSGDWELDASRSTLPDAMAVESIVLKVTQTEKDLKIESATKTSKNNNAGTKGSLIKQTGIYSLEGKEMLSTLR